MNFDFHQSGASQAELHGARARARERGAEGGAGDLPEVQRLAPAPDGRVPCARTDTEVLREYRSDSTGLPRTLFFHLLHGARGLGSGFALP